MRSLFAVLALLAQTTFAAEWAVLVAGSNGYYNYRHQSDVCHAFHVLTANGFPADHIVVMIYDDIANDPSNPFPGNLINEPNGPNVYDGCQKDYTGDDVSPENFLKVLSGADMSGIGSGRSINSTADDNIFVFFSDHGAVGLIAFPNSELYADDLNKVLLQMHKQKRYSKLLFYLEACESGSMFNKILRADLNILAITAADPSHSSYAIYYDDARGTYLGDMFSVYWMQDAEKQSPAVETVGSQFDTVRTETTASQVCSYGDESIKNEFLASYIGQGKSSKFVSARHFVRGEVADSRDIERLVLQHRLASAKSEEERVTIQKALSQLLAERKRFHLRLETFALHTVGVNATSIALGINQRNAANDDLCTASATVNFPCLKQLVNGWKAHCGNFDSYSLKHIAVLNEVCHRGVDGDFGVEAMSLICDKI